MALHAIWTFLDGELDLLSTHIRAFAAKKKSLNVPANFTLTDECLLEGMLSRAWQAWCEFCRNCVIDSCMGTITSSGAVIATLPDAFSVSHVSGAAVYARQLKSQPPYWGKRNNTFRSEPTWGDVNVLTTIIQRLAPGNAPQLLAAFSSGHTSARVLQTIRNAAAHNNHQTFDDIQLLRASYLVFPIVHPTHALFWVEPKSKDFLVTHAIQGLRDAGQAAIL